jgi:hypothetical protein
MRTRYLFAFFAVVAALLLPCAAHAQCAQFYCESFGTYDPGSNLIFGYSMYTADTDWAQLSVDSYVNDPSGNYTPVGSSMGYFEAYVSFYYDPGPSGIYGVWGSNSYQIEGWWEYDGASEYDVGVTPPVAITSCPAPSLGAGGNSFTIGGSGFLNTSPSISWSGDGGVDFLQSDSSVSVVSDSQISVYADLSSLSSEGWITISDASAACVIAVAATPPPSGPVVTIKYNGSIVASTVPGFGCVYPNCSVVVGQQITLTGSPYGGSWYIGGTTYNQWSGNGGPPTPVDGSSNPVSFFWVTGGNFTVNYWYNGSTASVAFSVAAPTLSVFNPMFGPTGNGLSVISNGLLEAYAQVNWAVTPPSLYAGTVTFIQVVTGAIYDTSGPNVLSQTCSPQGNSPWLDGANPYPYGNNTGNSGQFWDEPRFNLQGALQLGETAVARQDGFNVYLLWQPLVTGTSFAVPLETMSWGVNDGATFANNAWAPNGGAALTSAPSQTSSYPTWSSVAGINQPNTCGVAVGLAQSGQSN